MLSSKRLVSACLGCPTRLPMRPFTTAAAAAPAQAGQRARLAAPSLLTKLSSRSSRQPARSLCAAAVDTAKGAAPARSAVITQDPANNVSASIYSKMVSGPAADRHTPADCEGLSLPASLAY